MKAHLIAADWVPDEARPLFEAVQITPPNETFTHDMGFTVGGRHLDLRFLGRGHTDSDIVILVDDVMFAGDLIEEGAPPSFGDSYPRAWVHTLERVADLAPGTVVPGHGDIVDRGFVAAQRDEIRAAIAAIDAGEASRGPFSAAVTDTVATRLGAESAQDRA